MVSIKFFEVRDRATFIPVMAILAHTESGQEQRDWLLRRAGYVGRYVFIVRLTSSPEVQYSQWDWNGRTMQAAASYIEDHFDELEDGAVVDVEFILGETDQPKRSERHAG